MKMLTSKVKKNVLKTLDRKKLFRYDCNTPEESEVSVLEKKVAEIVGTKYAVAMNSCSSALYVSLLCVGIKEGDKVAVPAFTFIAVPSSIVHAGAQPVLIEVTSDYVIDLEDFEKKVKDKTVKALLLSYMRGRVPNIDKVLEICKKYDVILLEDSAHSLGVLFNGKQTGTFGVTGAFSAQSYKMIDGGEGGFLVTNDKEIAFKAMLYAGCYEHNWKKHFGTESDHELLKKMTSAIPAYNFRMSNLSASALIPQLTEIDKRVKRFNKNFNKMVKILKKSKYIRVPEFTIGMRPAADSIQWEFVNLSGEQIDNIEQDLLSKNVKIEIFKGANARSFWNWTFFKHNENCFYTKDLIQRTVDMRLWLYYSSDKVEEIGNMIVDSINKHA